MKIKNISQLEIKKNKIMSSNFVLAHLEKIATHYKIYKGDFKQFTRKSV